MLAAGTFAAFVGGSGSGKSTIVRLLLRLYDPSSGVILVDDVDIRSVDVAWLRSRFGTVSQEPELFAESLGYNIEYGCCDDDAAHGQGALPVVVHDGAVVGVSPRVQQAAAAANALAFIQAFPRGFGTRAGDGGSQLSGGQKQRIAIARAIVRQPRVLILDEATSALDSESERVVQEALDALVSSHLHGVTTLAIAHRLSTIRHADVIYVFDHGRLVEQGTHDAMSSRPGSVYGKLVHAQSFASHA